jgi:thioredoxin-related protein
VPITTRFRFLVFSSKTCGPCIAMHKAGTLERVAQKYPNLSVTTLWISDASGESPSLASPRNKDGIDYKANDKLSDRYKVSAVPTIILEAKGVGELARIEGAASARQFEQMYLESVEFAERADLTPWKR